MNPASEVLAIPLEAGSDIIRDVLEPLAETDAVAAVAGTTVPMTRAETARKQVRSRGSLMLFRERGARRDM
ncbi:hypothetical protein GCM10010213_17620 [Microbacterium maritypicum]|nr:hypothetical protein GCM10010213_17620 [Microbacterium liquefaciens]